MKDLRLDQMTMDIFARYFFRSWSVLDSLFQSECIFKKTGRHISCSASDKLLASCRLFTMHGKYEIQKESVKKVAGMLKEHCDKI